MVWALRQVLLFLNSVHLMLVEPTGSVITQALEIHQV
jgi:hypothetical protein